MSAWCVLLAAGKGERARLSENKVFFRWQGRSVLSRCIDALAAADAYEGIVLVLSPADMPRYEALLRREGPLPLVKEVVPGGATRRESGFNGLRAVPEGTALVSVHDAARPFVTPEIIRATLADAAKYGSGVISTPVTDTIKRIDPATGRVTTLERGELRAVQTPQSFNYKLLMQAHMRAAEEGFSATDDAVVFEHAHGTVRLTEAPGAERNVKLTLPQDFAALRDLPQTASAESAATPNPDNPTNAALPPQGAGECPYINPPEHAVELPPQGEAKHPNAGPVQPQRPPQGAGECPYINPPHHAVELPPQGEAKHPNASLVQPERPPQGACECPYINPPRRAVELPPQGEAKQSDAGPVQSERPPQGAGEYTDIGARRQAPALAGVRVESADFNASRQDRAPTGTAGRGLGEMPVEPGFPRIGTGYDAHRLVGGRRLVLCGVDVPHDRGLDGHSDADVAVHALMDAILGALGEGDIGRHFPDSDPRYRGISSMLLLERVMEIARGRGCRVGNADVTIVAQRPKLAPYIPQMRRNLANAMGVSIDRASVKATTTERMGFEGEELGISAQAAVLLIRAEP